MENNIMISDNDIQELRNKINEHKKQEEFHKLKQELFDINFKANNALHEFNGGMKQVDTERALKRKDGKQTLSDIIVNRFMKMCSLRPVAGNLIAIGMAMAAILSLHYYLDSKELHPLVMFLTYFIEAAIGIQVIKSASRSVVLPVSALLFTTTALTQIKTSQTLFQHPVLFFQIALIVAIAGVAVSVFTID